MNKLTKQYKIVHKGKNLIFPVTEEGNDKVIYPSVDATAVEFDTYAEAKTYVDEHGLVYEEPKFGTPIGE